MHIKSYSMAKNNFVAALTFKKMWRKSPASNAWATIFKVVLHSRKNMYFYFFQLKHLRKIWLLKKVCKSKSCLNQKLCQFLFFDCDIILDNLSKLGQISCVISYYTEIKDSFHLGNWASFLSIFLKIDTKWKVL